MGKVKEYYHDEIIKQQEADEADEKVEITEEYFLSATGYPPKDDDLERCNCNKVGATGHYACGWCLQCNKPRFMCGHIVIN